MNIQLDLVHLFEYVYSDFCSTHCLVNVYFLSVRDREQVAARRREERNAELQSKYDDWRQGPDGLEG